MIGFKPIDIPELDRGRPKLKGQMACKVFGLRVFTQLICHDIEGFFGASERDIGRANFAVFVIRLLNFDLLSEDIILLGKILGG